MTDRIELKVSPEDKILLQEEAKNNRLTLSAYVRLKLLNNKF